MKFPSSASSAILPVLLAATAGACQPAPAVVSSPPMPRLAPATGSDTQTRVRRIAESARFQTAQATLKSQFDQYVAELIHLTEIPAPPFKESARAEAFAEMLRELGLSEVAIDAEGNVLALRPGTDPEAPLVVVSAHLDTVFPEGTDVKVRREGIRLHAPGIQDDSRGLANLLAYIRALDAAGIQTRRPILFVGTVGEEGLGDLRGVRYLLTEGSYKDRIGTFFSIDSSNPARVVHAAVGSKRYHAVFSGPGGHSYGAYGIVNPMAAMSAAVTELYKIETPTEPKTTYSASVTGGGTSINSIPSEVWMDFDMRSRDAAELARLEERFLTILQKAVANENAARSTANGKITVDPQPVGDRPAGATPLDSTLVQNVAAAIRTMGYEPDFHASSTDSNIPMSLGIPAVTVGSGGESGRTHSTEEWTDISKPESVRGMTVGLLALLAVAGVSEK